MLKVSTRGQYALLIMVTLAEQDPQKFIPLKVLSHRHNLSLKYLEQILLKLSKSGLVSGVRGSSGGYRLLKATSEYSVGEILRCTEGEISVKPSAWRKNVSSVGNDVFWQEFDTLINDYLNKTTLQSLVEKNRQFAEFDYYI